MTEAELIEKAAQKHVLFCGERIVDVYHYVKPLGRPTKDAIVAVELVNTEFFEGGVTAAALHAHEFAKGVDIWVGGDSTHKVRYVESSHLRKLFECYCKSNDDVVTPTGRWSLDCYDAVIVLDYGHGMATPEFIKSLADSRYVAINVQTNSGNYGFNLATKYPYADYLCVDEPEARLATQNRHGPIEESIFALSSMAEKVVVTMGKAGAIGWCAGELSRCHAFTDSVVDTIGAGDAFFSITALIAEEADMPTLLRVGNAAGALKAQTVGHRKAVRKDELLGLLQRFPRQADAGAQEGRGKRKAHRVQSG